MLLQYLGKLKIQIWCRCGRKCKQIAFLIASNFVIHPQILIFLVFKIASHSPYWLQIKLSMSLFFYLFTFAINLWNQKFVTALRCHLSVCQQSTWYSVTRTRFWQSVYLKEYTAKRLTDEFLEKGWTKRGVNKLSKQLRDTGTVDRWPSSCRQCIANVYWCQWLCLHWRNRWNS